MLRTSERSDFKRCPWKWFHAWELGLRQIDPRPNAADFGSGLHLCLAEHYKPGKKRGPHPVTTWKKWMADQQGQFVRVDDPNETEGEGVAKYEDALALGIEMLECYIDKWGSDRNWTIIAPEQRFSIKIPHPQISNRSIVLYVGTFDGIYRDEDTGLIHILETKSTNKNLDKFMIDVQWAEQRMAYSAVATQTMRTQGKIGSKESVRGITYNLLRRAKQDDRPIGPDGRRHNKPTREHCYTALVGTDPTDSQPSGWTEAALKKMTIDEMQSIAAAQMFEIFGEVSARQPTSWFMRETLANTAKERAAQLVRIGEEALHMQDLRTGRRPVMKNPTMDCSWQCEFFQLCQIDESGDDYEYFRDSVFQKTDPYADHRLAAINSKISVINKRKSGVS